MAIIYSYPLNDDIKPLDELVGTTEKSINGQLKTVTRNFLLADLAEFFIVDGGLQKEIILTTEGTSGASTLDQLTGVLNIPQYSGATDLGYIASALNGIVTSSTGLDATIPLANSTNAGLLNPAGFIVLGNTSGTNTGDQNLQSVTNMGSVTTNSITANSFIKSGGTGTNILLDNGSTVALSSVVGNTNLSTSQTATNFTINSDTGTDASVPLGNGTLAGATLNDYTTAEKNKLAAITGTNTGDQNLQQVTDLGNAIILPSNRNNAIDITLPDSVSQVSKGILVTIEPQTGAYPNPDAYVAKIKGQNPGSLSNYISGFYAVATGADNYSFASEHNIGTVTSNHYFANNASGVTSDFASFNTNFNVNVFKIDYLGNTTAAKFIKEGGTSSQFLMADGSVTIGNGGVYSYEIHVSQVDGNDTTGTGAVLNPVASITKALTLVGSQRKTIIIHPGNYTESPSITVQYTVLTTYQATGGNTLITGTVSTSTGCSISGLKMTNLNIDAPTGTGNVNILNCDISGTLTRTNTGTYTLIRFCDIGITNINSTSGTVAIFGGNPGFITVNNAGASVLVKNAVCISPVVLVGNATFADCILIPTGPTTNALTSSAGTFITLANSQCVIPTFQNVARVSLSGFYSILNCVFDKPNSTLVALSGTGGSTNSIVYSQFINADKFIKQGGLSTEFLKADGSVSTAPTNLTTSQTASNFTINSDTGTDASVPLGDGTLAGATLNNYTTTEKNKLAAITGTNTGDQNLQQVTDLGASTTNPITSNSFVKSGGTSSQILAADGSVITAGTNITITGGQISSIGGSGGGGSSVNYYLNGGTSQGTFGGTTYYEFSKTAVIGTGADFSRSSNGYIASFITDVADPSLLLIPAGNWNLEFFFHSNSPGGSPSFYVELYKYDGTTFTSIASSSATPEGITNGTAIDAYFTPLAVPETVLTVNDRLAIRVFVNASSKTITLHTQNGHLCEVITTFTSGLTALNGLQAQVQNFAAGTTGTDFAINSSGSTHTFNLPSASATARGVVTTGTQTIAGIKTFISSPEVPTQAIGISDTTVATTAFVTNAINSATPGTGYTVYNILITSSANITTQTTGTSGGVSYVQNGRNVMINNGATAITIDVTNAVTDFIASYTKIGNANITFIGTGITFVNSFSGVVLNGLSGSTALLVKNGSNVYLSINNIIT